MATMNGPHISNLTFEQASATTLICDAKQLKKVIAIKTSLEKIQNVIYFEEDGTSNDTGFSESLSDWTVASLSEVERLGKTNPIPPSLPSKNGTAVVMYTSGSTGLPKVGFLLFVCFFMFPVSCLSNRTYPNDSLNYKYRNLFISF